MHQHQTQQKHARTAQLWAVSAGKWRQSVIVMRIRRCHRYHQLVDRRSWLIISNLNYIILYNSYMYIWCINKESNFYRVGVWNHYHSYMPIIVVCCLFFCVCVEVGYHLKLSLRQRIYACQGPRDSCNDGLWHSWYLLGIEILIIHCRIVPLVTSHFVLFTNCLSYVVIGLVLACILR